MSETVVETEGDAQKVSKSKVKQLLKIAMPHVALYTFLFGYLSVGAWAFTSVENQAERIQQTKKLRRIESIYRQIADEMIKECTVPPNKLVDFNEQLYESISVLSQFMEKRGTFRLYPYEKADLDRVLPPRWNLLSSMLYALSILTTTGYADASPSTSLGQWLSIGYGLIGIPLMILAAVDIGRFLSDVVLFIYVKIEVGIHSLTTLLGFSFQRSTMISQVEAKAIRFLQNIQRQSFAKSNGDYAMMKECGEEYVLKTNLTSVDSENYAKIKCSAPDNECRNLDQKLPKAEVISVPIKETIVVTKPQTSPTTKKHLPLWVNAAILLLFCMLGGLVYIASGTNHKTFIEGFFITFNLVANLTMSEMPTDVSHVMTVVYIFVFVTFGLAVLSMCAELAASELKWIFLKIHYFGRKINWKRKSAKKEEEEIQTEEVSELLKIINEIRKKYPEKDQVTALDILKYVHEMDDRSRFNGTGANPYRTFNMFLLQQQRRDTIAFMPRSIEGLKFADELEDLDEATAVWMIPAEVSLLDSHTMSAKFDHETSGGINWSRAIRPRSDPNTFIPFLPYLFRTENKEFL